MGSGIAEHPEDTLDEINETALFTMLTRGPEVVDR